MPGTNCDRIEKLKIGRVLGQGTFGITYAVTDPDTDKVYALKILDFGKIVSETQRQEEMETSLQEIYILSKLHNAAENGCIPFNICLLDWCQTGSTIQVLMPILKGMNLMDWRMFWPKNLALKALREKVPHLNRKVTLLLLHIMACMAAAVSELHSRDIIHRDIKLNNMVIDSLPLNPTTINNIKVTLGLVDFGMACNVSGVYACESTPKGTLQYMSREVLKSYAKPIPPEQFAAADIYALGVSFHILITGKQFIHGNKMEIIGKIMSDNITIGDDMMSNRMVDLLEMMLHEDPLQRPPIGMVQILLSRIIDELNDAKDTEEEDELLFHMF